MGLMRSTVLAFLLLIGCLLPEQTYSASSSIRCWEYIAREHSQTSLATPTALDEFRFALTATPLHFSPDDYYFLLPSGAQSLGENKTFPDIVSLQSAFPPGMYTA